MMTHFRNEFYKKLFESLEDNAVLMRVEEDGRYYPIWCSPEFTEMMEGTAEEFIRLESGGTMTTIHPDDREEIAYLFRHHVTKAGTNSLDVRKRTIRGRWLWVNIHYAFVEEDGVQYAYCNYFNVTYIKEAEQRAQTLYKRIRTELESMGSDNLLSLRLNLTQDKIEDCRSHEPGGRDLSGGSVHDLFRQRLSLLLFDKDQARFFELFSAEKLIETYFYGNSTISDVFFSRRPNGRECFIRYSVRLRQDPVSGDIIAFATEKDYNGEMVSEALLNKALAEQYDMITYLVNGQYGVVIGDAARIARGSIFPRERDGSYDRYLAEQVAPVLSGTEEEKAACLAALRPEQIERELAAHEPYAVNIVCQIDGETFYKRFVFFLVDREAKFYLLLKSDTTEIQKEQIQRNEQLRSVLEEAKQANIAKTVFLSNMSHEIRTPMNAIIGLDSIALKEPDLSPRMKAHLEKIGGSARHLLSLINDILDMSRIESGRMVMKKEEFSFSSMLEQINAMINSQCQDKKLHYNCVIQGLVDEFYIGDDMKLKQVLINILGNAVKFTPPGGMVCLIVERVAKFEDKTTLRFIVRDTGIGMDAAFLPKIFDAFSQEDGATTNKFGGTGLGMAITKNIVEMMNGNISVTSKKGRGSEFIVNVTLKDSNREDSAGCGFRPQDLNVLIIDDDASACEHAKLVLEEVGIAADFCLNGQDALDMIRLGHARRDDYNMILMDYKMPEQDGLAVTREIRKIVGEESTVIILTAYNWDNIIEEAIDAGVDSFMAKPLFASNVLSGFRQVLARKNICLTQKRRKADLAGRHVLLAEDMLVNAEIMKEILAMRQMKVDHAENGQMAVRMFSESPLGHYDAVLMDVRMPVMDGLKAMAAIRALPRPDSRVVPIIAMTANAFDEDVQRSLQAGMNAHLSKPVEPDHLYETLESLIADEGGETNG